jgi:RHS repeat-associated protein
MGYFSTAPTRLPTAATTPACRRRMPRTNRTRAKNRIGTHFRNAILSTKYTDDETGLLYYGYRYLSPLLGRWINKDPIEENGGCNLLSSCANNCIDWVDGLGEVVVFRQGANDLESTDPLANPGYSELHGYTQSWTPERSSDHTLCRLTNYKAIGSATIHIKKNYSATAPRRRPWGGARSTLDHERVHVLIYKGRLENLDRSATGLMEIWTCCACAQAKIMYLQKLKQYMWLLQAVEHDDFDLRDYWPGPERDRVDRDRDRMAIEAQRTGQELQTLQQSMISACR